jgi:hypothetical protein
MASYDMTHNLTGNQRGQTAVTQQLSWWPKRFDLSALWTGSWTFDCEKWYLERLAEYRAPNVRKTLRTQQKWKEAIKFNYKVHKAVGQNERLSAEWLESSPRTSLTYPTT